MNRYLITMSMACIILVMASCSGNQKNKPAEQATETTQEEVVLNEKLQKRVGSWIEKGMECYGIVMAPQGNDGKAIAKSVKCKVVAIKPDMIKLKTLESVSLMESRGCDRLGLSYGDTWWEEEGDIFKTRAEADAYLSQKGWLIK